MQFRPVFALLAVTLATACGQAAATDVASGTDTLAAAETAVADVANLADAASDVAAPGLDPAIAAIQAQVDALAIDTSVKNWRTKVPKPKLVAFTPGRSYYWLLSTDKGELKLKFRPADAPMHVTSTIYLTLLGFYDTLKFHRIILGFMAQGGDPLGSGSGGPGYAYALEVNTTAKHDARGVLSMANAGTDTDGSQFFLTFAPQPSLDGKYSVFGNLIAGSDTLSAIEAGGTVGEGVPVKVKILAATVSVE